MVEIPIAQEGLIEFVGARHQKLVAEVARALKVKLAMGAVLADAIGWGGHVLMHHVPVLWRFHKVHHTDAAFDAALGFRFHPMEVLFMSVLTASAVALLGLPADGVLPGDSERWLMRLLVTPEFHRVHHLRDSHSAASNCGFVFPFWDHMFGTYAAPRDQPADAFGLEGQGAAAGGGHWTLLTMPFRR